MACAAQFVIVLGGLSCGDRAPPASPEQPATPRPGVLQLMFGGVPAGQGAVLLRVTTTPPHWVRFRQGRADWVVYHRDVSDQEVLMIMIGRFRGDQIAGSVTVSDGSDLTLYTGEVLESTKLDGVLVPTSEYYLTLRREP